MMLQRLKSLFERAAGQLADALLGPLSRSTRLTADADMCLLLRVEVPRHCASGRDLVESVRCWQQR
jgi:hypothetical protein